ncbi:MAG TPA: NAD(P)/FAD-dependent oxidoreductase [Solirubrobacteraceae bacterium]|nr:NAD(P)/FAD-dependent oxidoreductase [Solirubrobacteraceae bacterium]
MPSTAAATVGVIGAGGSGILAAAYLRRRGISFELLEARDAVGGTWHYDAEGTGSAAYDSLVMNTSRLSTSPAALRIPGRPWRYATRAEMQRYMERLVEREALREHVRLGWRVTQAVSGAEGWTLQSDAGEQKRFETIVCALGTNGRPKWAPLPGEFSGKQLHSAEYRRPAPFAGRNVLVIGLGTSGAEVAGELVGTARSVHVAVRSPLWMMTRRLGGVPIDWIDNQLASRVIPWRIRREILCGLCWATTGRLFRRGLPRPTRRCGDDIIAISDTFPRAVRRGGMSFHGGVERVEGSTVRFEEGAQAEIDVIVHATGFDPPTGFLPGEAQPSGRNLYRRILHTGPENLYFVGMFEAHRALLPTAEAQARWTAAALAGEVGLPSREQRRAIATAEGERGESDFGDRREFMLDWAKYRAMLRRDAGTAHAA